MTMQPRGDDPAIPPAPPVGGNVAVARRQETAGAAPGTGSRKLTERVFRIRESGIIAVLVVFVGVTTAIRPSFPGCPSSTTSLSETRLRSRQLSCPSSRGNM